jgi:hypothetical protein
MKSALTALGCVLLLGLPRTADACAGCRNPNLPITRLSTAQLLPGQVRASALLTASALNIVHQAGCPDPSSCAEQPVQPPFLHDQTIYPGELRAVVEVGLTPAWGIEAQLPVRVVRTSIQYTDLGGAPHQPVDPDVHHRNETLAGMADPWLLLRWGMAFGKTAFTARGGTSVPLGRTEADPFALGARGVRHQHIQFGNGTFDPVVMLDLSRNFGVVDLSAYAQTQLTLYQNRKGFQAGSRFFVGALAGMLVWPRLTAAMGVDVMSERPERWGGQTQQDGNLGRHELLGGISFTRGFGPTIASLILRFPIYRHIVKGDQPPGRLSSPLMLSVVVSRTLGHAARQSAPFTKS